MPSKKIWLEGVPQGMYWQTLLTALKPFGVVKVHLVETSAGSCAVVKFQNDIQAAHFVERNPTIHIMGSEIRLNVFKKRFRDRSFSATGFADTQQDWRKADEDDEHDDINDTHHQGVFLGKPIDIYSAEAFPPLTTAGVDEN